jgi:hypothetical protein
VLGPDDAAACSHGVQVSMQVSVQVVHEGRAAVDVSHGQPVSFEVARMRLVTGYSTGTLGTDGRGAGLSLRSMSIR